MPCQLDAGCEGIGFGNPMGEFLQGGAGDLVRFDKGRRSWILAPPLERRPRLRSR